MTAFQRPRIFVPIAILIGLAFAGLALIGPSGTEARRAPDRLGGDALHPLMAQAAPTEHGTLTVNLDRASYAQMKSAPGTVRLAFPLPSGEVLPLALERFAVVDPQARFLTGEPGGGGEERPVPDVTLLRGTIQDEPGSHAFLAFTGRGSANGYVTTASGERFILSQSAADAGEARGTGISIHRERDAGMAADLPDWAAFCGVPSPAVKRLIPQIAGAQGPAILEGGPRVANVAIEADQAYYDLFGDLTAAESYIVALIGAVSDIYERDIDTRLNLVHSRVWPMGGEPFGADNLFGFQSYYHASEDTTGLNLVHLLSGRRDLSYGGVAFVAGTCSGDAYGIDGYLNGSFPVPFGELSLGNWDVIVTAHEMGHNFGTFHTHDGYFPTIDDCGNGVPSRGTIMSYCHIHAGYSMNIDMRFHALVQEVMQLDVAPGSCHGWDCNGNGVDDAEDIASTASPDVNLNGIPDECEDCNSNGTLDPQDIAMGAPDVNGNGVPDECEPDCNSNSSPDDWDIFITASDDDNGNNIPDECEPDCNGNSTPDFVEAALGTADDFNRNNIPDECEDCNVNGVPDWLDMERQHNIYIADRSGWVQELSWEAGYPIKQFGGPPTMNDPQGVAFGPDRQLYVANTGANNILRVDVDNDVITTFVATGSGGLSQPTALVFGSGGRLYVASSGTDEILLYNGTTGASMGAFVSAGSGGLDEPLGLEFGPRGNLFVSSGLTNQVIEYNGATGALVGDFADNTGGELATPRGLACHPNGNLLVASYLTSQVLEYDGTTGAFVGVFNDDVTPTGVWGLRAGPNGNIYAMRSAGTIRLLELLPIGRYYRARVRGNNANIPSPTGVAFRPASQFDCNGNLVLDTCDITSGTSFDVNANGIPDECESIACTCPNQGDVAPLATTGDGSIDILDVVAKIDYVFRSGPALTHDGTCPGERADWNCDGIVDVLDVVGSVDFVFRSSGIGPCQPCDCFIYPGDCPPWP